MANEKSKKLPGMSKGGIAELTSVENVVETFKLNGRFLFAGLHPNPEENVATGVSRLVYRAFLRVRDFEHPISGKICCYLFEAVAPNPAPKKGGLASTMPYDESDEIVGRELNICVSKELATDLDKALNDNDSELRKVTSIPIERAFVYIDISDFSTYPAPQQALIINSLSYIIRNVQHGDTIEARLCIGDGFIFVFKEQLPATIFATLLAHSIQIEAARDGLPVDFHFRMSVHYGQTYCFWDVGRRNLVAASNPLDAGNWNYIGDAINGGQRVLAAIGKDLDDVVFVSDEIVQALRTLRVKNNWDAAKILRNLENKGRRKDKHEKHWRVYQLNHTRICDELNQKV